MESNNVLRKLRGITTNKVYTYFMLLIVGFITGVLSVKEA